MEIKPISASTAARRARTLRRAKLVADDKPGTALVPTGERQDHAPSEHPDPYAVPPLASFAVQALNLTEPRGLRAGPLLRKAAKSAYLNREFSGTEDRRANSGEYGERDL